MPRFLDSHTLGGMDEATLKQLQKAPKDEFGVTHVNIMYNKAEPKTAKSKYINGVLEVTIKKLEKEEEPEGKLIEIE